MNYIIDFLRDHYRLIFECIAFITLFIVGLLKNRKNVINQEDSIKKDILDILPELINKVEHPGDGDSKLITVLKFVECFIKNKYKIDDFDRYRAFVIDGVENILSTPKKKEV